MQNQKNPKTKGIIEVANLGTPKIPSPVTNIRRVGTPYIPFGDDNDFPQKIAELSRESATLGSVLSNKSDFASGDLIEVDNKAVSDFFKKVNKSESFKQVAEKLFNDFYLSGNAYIRICRPLYSKVLGEYSIDHIPQETIRRHRDLDGFLFSADWTSGIYSKNKIAEFPKFSPVDDKYEESIIHLKDYVSGFPNYGLPTYMGAVQYAKLEYLIGLYNNNQFDNQMLPSGILEVITANMEEENAQAFIKSVKDKYVGVEKGNNGKILVVGKDSNESKATFTPISQEQEGSFSELKQISTETIITACQWFPSLSGIMIAGKLGNNQQVLQEFDIAVKNVSKAQLKLIDAISSVIKLTNAGSFIAKFINNKPGYVTKITDRVSDSQLNIFKDLLVASISEIDFNKKKMLSNSIKLLFGFSDDEINSMIYGSNSPNNP